MLRRMTVIFGACGFLIAILLAAAWRYLTGHTSINPHNAPFFDDVTEWLWPSSLMLMAWHDAGPWKSALGFLLSAIANGIIYSMVGFFFGLIIKLLNRQRETR